MARRDFGLSLSLSLSLLVSFGCSGGASLDERETEQAASPLGATAPPDEEADEPGDHGANEPWVRCPARDQRTASDPLGPVIAHGFREAPGYAPGVLTADARAAFRRSRLRRAPSQPGFLFEAVTLPREPNDARVTHLAESAIRLAGLDVPASARVVRTRTLEEPSAGARRTWEIGFFRAGVRLTPGRCRVSIDANAATDATDAWLWCSLPAEAPRRFEAFRVDDRRALSAAAFASGVAPLYSDVSRRYEVRDGRANARVYVVHADERRERLTVLDGAGRVVATGTNERPFTFSGYDLDYLTGLRATLTAPVPVGTGQTEVLDTATHDPTRRACTRFEGTAPTYAGGFVVCDNDVLRGASPFAYQQPLVAPRGDDDFSNSVSVGDPLGPQLLFFNSDVAGAPLLHGTLAQVTSRPLEPLARDEYLRIGNEMAQPIGPAHHAELQAFYSAGQRLRFYNVLDSTLSPGLQDRWRTELVVHWNPELFGEGPGEFNAGGRAGRFRIKLSDWRETGINDVQVGPAAFDGTGDGSIFAHEYHHHVQESLAYDEGWELYPGFDELFPDPTGDEPTCEPDPDCGRRVRVLEGTADGFGALAVQRGVIGTMAAPTTPLGDLLGRCAEREAFGTGLVQSGVRAVCNDTVFGYWAEVQEPGPFDPPPCVSVKGQPEAARLGARRQLVIGGAAYLYQQRFFEAGRGQGVPGRHLLEAERALQELTDGEIQLANELITYHRTQPAAAARRYEYTARAAFLEKGVFPLVIHALAAISAGGPDARPVVQCDAPSCPAESGLLLASATLTASGPLEWTADPNDPAAELPVFDLYAPPGTRFANVPVGPPGDAIENANVLWLELATSPGFLPGQGYFARVPLLFSPTARVNCAPAGFFRRAATDFEWREAVRQARNTGGRVYYRSRYCLAGVSPDSPTGCITSTPASAPTWVDVGTGGPGCACRAAGGNSSSGAISLLLVPLLLVARRRR